MSAKLRLLDQFGLLVDGVALSVPQPARRLLAFLAIERRAVHRMVAATQLWPDSDEVHAQGSLRSALWRVPRGPVVCDEQTLRLSPDVECDTASSEAFSDQIADAANRLDAQAVRRSMSVELLPGWYDEWVVVERERLRCAHIQDAETLAARLLADGSAGAAVIVASAVVEFEPLRESAVRLVIRANAATGNRVDAIRAYDRLVAELEHSFGVAPMPATQACVAEVTGRQR